MVLLIQQEYLFIGKCSSHGNRTSRFKIPVYHIVCAVAGDFSGTVQIDKHGMGKILPPRVQVFDRHDLPAEQYFIQVCGHTVSKTVQGSDDA